MVFIIAVNATVSSELLHARTLTRGRIPELFKWHQPSGNQQRLIFAGEILEDCCTTFRRNLPCTYWPWEALKCRICPIYSS